MEVIKISQECPNGNRTGLQVGNSSDVSRLASSTAKLQNWKSSKLTVQLCRRRTIHVLVGIPTTSLYRIARDGTSALASDRSWALYCRPICSTSRLGASRSIVPSTNQNPSQNRHISRFLPKNTKTNSILTTSPTNQQHDPSTAPVVRAGVGHRRPHRSRGG